MRILTLVLFVAFSSFISAQDAYHTALTTALQADYGLTNPSFPIENSETGMKNSIESYGNISRVENNVTDQSFTQSTGITVNAPGANQWDAGYNATNKTGISNGDLIIMTFWARKLSATANMYVLIEHKTTFDKAVYTQIELTEEWQQYWYPAKVTQSYGAGDLQIGFHLATQAQQMEIGGMAFINYGSSYALSDAPNNSTVMGYEGEEADAAWRADAASRIESLRKANLNLTIQDVNGNPIPEASVSIEQKEHAFGFGSAVVPSRFPNNRAPNETYVDKIYNLDGNGHGFNVAVTENALKWDGWVEEWIGTPAETVSAIQSMTDNGIDVRGHVLIWPGWDLMPADINQNKFDIPYIKNAIFQRLDDMLTHPQLKDLVREWDIINEITFVRDLENHLKTQNGYTTGREIYKEIFDRAQTTAPDIVRYINDYAVITQGAKDGLQNQRFIGFLDELFDAGAPIDGIGIQAHIPSPLPSILDVKDRLDQYTTRYNVPIKITEYDTNIDIGDALAGDYMGDFLTMVFSHANVDAFLMWGFWDGNHWKENAPMFDMAWNIKPAGTQFNELVFGEWWTDEQGTADANGAVAFRPFKGTHTVTVTSGNETYSTEVDLTEDLNRTITADFTSAIHTISASPFAIYPNPVSDQMEIQFPNNVTQATTWIYDIAGRLIRSDIIRSGDSLPINLENGQYLLKIRTDKNIYSDLFVVMK